MKNPNILIVVNDFTTIYNFRIELVQCLLDRGYTVNVALPDDKRNVQLSSIGCIIHNIALSRFGTNPVADFKVMLEIRGLINKINPCVVLTYTAKPNIYGGMAARLTGTPYISNVTGLGANFQSKNLIASIMLILQKIAYKKALRVFFQNEDNLRVLKEANVVKDNYAILPGSGVNIKTNVFEPMVGNDKLKFITIARIRKDKGYDELFDVTRRLKSEGIDNEFHIVGWYEEDSYKPVVEELLAYGNVKFYENVPHDRVHTLIRKCDCLIHPSHHEGMSNVVLEAAACGRPCIVSNIHGCIEGVEDGKTGYHFIVKDSDSLYNQIKKLISLDKEQIETMNSAARKKIERDFDREIIIREYLKLIEPLAK